MNIYESYKRDREAAGGGSNLRLRSIMRGELLPEEGQISQSMDEYYAQRRPLGSSSLSAKKFGAYYIIYSYDEPITIVSPKNHIILRGTKFSTATSKHQTAVSNAAMAEGLAINREDDDDSFLNTLLSISQGVNQ